MSSFSTTADGSLWRAGPGPPIDEVRRRIRWFTRLRWLAVGGVAAALVAAWVGLGIRFALAPVLVLWLWLAAYNTLFHYLNTRIGHWSLERLLLAARGQVLLDLLTLVLLLYFSGGINNPFSFYFVFHTAIAGMLFPGRESEMITTLTVALYSAMVLLDYFGVVPHFPLEGLMRAPLDREGRYILARLFAFGTTLFIVRYFVGSLSRRLDARTQELVAANQKLMEADQARVQAVLTVTHELRAPLASVQTMLSTVLGGYAGKTRETILPLLERVSARIAGLLTLAGDLLDLHRLEGGGFRLEKVPLDLGQTIDEVIEELGGYAAEREVVVRRTGDARLPPVSGDPRSVDSILANLISNAIKYNRPGGKVDVSTRISGRTVEIAVVDTGTGIPPDDLPRVFDMFYQGSYARRMKRRGVGLGLSLVKRLVEAHGGRISVISEQDRGSTFTFTLRTAAAGDSL